MIGLALAGALCLGVAQVESAAGSAHILGTSDAPLLVLPRQSLTWATDGFGQVIGVTIPARPLPGRVRSIEPASPLPAPLRTEKGPSSLRIIGKTGKGRERDIAVLQWQGSVISWQRMSVPTAAFESSLAALAQWMATDSFAVVLDDGSQVRIAAEAQELSVDVGTRSGSAATAGLAGVPAGAHLAVPDATAPAAGAPAGTGLVQIGCDELYCRVSTNPDTVVDIEVTRTPPQVRVTSQTPSSLLLERAARELEATDEVMKDAPDDQRAILSRERAIQQARVDELRKAAVSERIRPTEAPIRVCVEDPVTRRVYTTIMVSIVASPGGGKDAAPAGAPPAQGQRSRTGRGAP